MSYIQSKSLPPTAKLLFKTTCAIVSTYRPFRKFVKMAEVTDDMRITKFATRPTAAPTSIPALNLNPSLPAIKTLVNFLDDINSFVSAEEPYSVKADEQGVQIGDFLVNNIELATAVKDARDKLDEFLNKGLSNLLKKDIDISVTYFKNWAGNQELSNGLLLLAQPKRAEHVKRIVKAVKTFNEDTSIPQQIKVRLNVHVYCCTGKYLFNFNPQIGCGGAYHSWSPLFPDKSTTTQIGLLLSMYNLTLNHDDPGDIITPDRIRLNDG